MSRVGNACKIMQPQKMKVSKPESLNDESQVAWEFKMKNFPGKKNIYIYMPSLETTNLESLYCVNDRELTPQ